MSWGAFYGTAALMVAVLSFFSGRGSIVSCGAMLCGMWIASNMVVANYTDRFSIYPYAAMDSMGATVSLFLFLWQPRWWSGVMAGAFIAQSLLHMAFLADAVAHYTYFIALNLLFVVELLAVAGAAVVEVRRRLQRRARRMKRAADYRQRPPAYATWPS